MMSKRRSGRVSWVDREGQICHLSSSSTLNWFEREEDESGVQMGILKFQISMEPSTHPDLLKGTLTIGIIW